jgi:catechol 2,3-dioxygenase-like lactoylglutathione lyase family enzyme
MTDSELSLLTEAAVARVHHAAIGTRDVEASLSFWRDGLGFDVLMDHAFDGPWPELFGSAGTSLRSVFLGDPSEPESGIVELVELEGMAPPVGAAAGPVAGFFLVSLYADLDAVLPRLAGLGVGGEPVVAPVGPVRLAVVHDPNGVRVELMDSVAQATMASLTEVGE